MTVIRYLRTLVRNRRAWHRARRDYRALSSEGRGATLLFSVGIHPDDPEWAGIDGVTALKTTVPLTPRGKRYMAGVILGIETACIRAVLAANAEQGKKIVDLPAPTSSPPSEGV
ncbi:hypothetical protein [Streptosporangium sp. NPDC002524]|uniref:hypothetical protein n=1 Tax=Streptosporangium sp. NPDC002524 TaxID=3154537 RepID=UPI003325516F